EALGIELLAESCRTGDVAKDDRDGLAHLARRPRAVERRCAVTAEFEPVRVLLTARRADRHALRLSPRAPAGNPGLVERSGAGAPRSAAAPQPARRSGAPRPPTARGRPRARAPSVSESEPRGKERSGAGVEPTEPWVARPHWF